MNIDKSTLRDKEGRYRTRSLFLETIDHKVKGYDPVFTLKPREHKGCASLKAIYLELALPESEYDFAIEVFGEWEHWAKLCASKWFSEHVVMWREELEVKIKSAAIKAMFNTARLEGSKGTAAARWIAEGKWKTTRGRPSKEEVERTTRIYAGIEEELDEHYSVFKDYNEKSKH